MPEQKLPTPEDRLLYLEGQVAAAKFTCATIIRHLVSDTTERQTLRTTLSTFSLVVPPDAPVNAFPEYRRGISEFLKELGELIVKDLT